MCGVQDRGESSLKKRLLRKGVVRQKSLAQSARELHFISIGKCGSFLNHV
jgi:hypothetical protein